MGASQVSHQFCLCFGCRQVCAVPPEPSPYFEHFADDCVRAFLIAKQNAISNSNDAARTKPIQRLSLALERVDDVKRRYGLAARVLHVRDGVANNILEEDLEHTARLLVDEARDALYSAAARQAADRGLGDALDIVSHYLAVAPRASHS